MDAYLPGSSDESLWILEFFCAKQRMMDRLMRFRGWSRSSFRGWSRSRSSQAEEGALASPVQLADVQHFRVVLRVGRVVAPAGRPRGPPGSWYAGMLASVSLRQEVGAEVGHQKSQPLEGAGVVRVLRGNTGYWERPPPLPSSRVCAERQTTASDGLAPPPQAAHDAGEVNLASQEQATTTTTTTTTTTLGGFRRWGQLPGPCQLRVGVFVGAVPDSDLFTQKSRRRAQ